MMTLDEVIGQLELVTTTMMGQMDGLRKEITWLINRYERTVAEKERYRLALSDILQMSDDGLIADLARKALNNGENHG
jgi:hypothetical protein